MYLSDGDAPTSPAIILEGHVTLTASILIRMRVSPNLYAYLGILARDTVLGASENDVAEFLLTQRLEQMQAEKYQSEKFQSNAIHTGTVHQICGA